MLHSLDAHAWGLLTHVYFAQWLLWTLPLTDPALRAAVKKFPKLVLAGACLPDLSLISPAFRHTHQWRHVHDMMRSARTEQETAIAVGYASHLLVDVVAHNHFVPAHEAMWLEQTLFTHILSEWAVDGHISPLVGDTPHALLAAHHEVTATVMARHFRCSEQRADQAILRLARADRLLRKTAVPHLLYHLFRHIDRRVFRHFVYYTSQTQAVLQHAEQVLQGEHPGWDPDPRHERTVLQELRMYSLAQLQNNHPAPLHLFAGPAVFHTSMKESHAIQAPIAAPASTSLG